MYLFEYFINELKIYLPIYLSHQVFFLVAEYFVKFSSIIFNQFYTIVLAVK